MYAVSGDGMISICDVAYRGTGSYISPVNTAQCFCIGRPDTTS